jgi:hypothetical protein
MEELSPVHRYAAGALFSLALNQAQIQRQSPVPEIELSEEDGPSYLTLSQEQGDVPWGSESCGLLRHVLRLDNVLIAIFASADIRPDFGLLLYFNKQSLDCSTIETGWHATAGCC